MTVSKENFGTLDDGLAVHKFILENGNGVIVEVHTNNLPTIKIFLQLSITKADFVSPTKM